LVTHLADCVTRDDIGLVVIDPIADFWPVRDENNASEVSEAILPLRQITNAGGAVLILHHPRKSGGYDGTAPRGSGQLPSFVDIMVELERDSSKVGVHNRRSLKGMGRYTETPRELGLALSSDGYEVRTRSVDQNAPSAEELMEGVLPAEPPGLSVTEIIKLLPAESLPKDASREVRRILGNWLPKGKVQRAKLQNSYHYYRPAEPEDSLTEAEGSSAEPGETAA
jgi:hypothetical protein